MDHERDDDPALVGPAREESDRDREGEGGDHRADPAVDRAEELRRSVRAVQVVPLDLPGHEEEQRQRDDLHGGVEDEAEFERSVFGDHLHGERHYHLHQEPAEGEPAEAAAERGDVAEQAVVGAPVAPMTMKLIRKERYSDW
ncbi:hypothetical protein [Amycolatopsis sp. lyj-23]|uniref:hypothetical protein n=1 Tax=Amycolatopsis sp. lyj-23 TaxID=2789283 RepID=UPI00397BAA75